MNHEAPTYRTTPAPGPLRIGPLVIDPPLLQAPMAGFTNYAYRAIVRRFGGVGLLATEMLSARGLREMNARRKGTPERLWGVRDEPRPLAVQIWDNDPATLAEAAGRLVEDYRPSVIDINFGCPARDVSQKAQSGAYLLGDPNRIGAIVARVVAACGSTPVTAKIRLGPSDETITAVDVVQAIEAAGGAAVTVHGRTARQMFRGQADWDRIAALKPHLKRIPLVGNGDLKTPEAVCGAFARYGIDGVMIGRAALARPWLFRRSAAALAGEPIPPEPSLTEQRDVLLEHYRLIVERFGERKGTILMRSYACCYVPGIPGARKFRARVSRAASVEEFVSAVEECFPRGA
jgi:tRNA-dihydrouridine synthase B